MHVNHPQSEGEGWVLLQFPSGSGHVLLAVPVLPGSVVSGDKAEQRGLPGSRCEQCIIHASSPRLWEDCAERRERASLFHTAAA